jgi:hypothetical protein
MTKRWYEKNVIIILAIVLFFPLGILMMWRYTKWKIWIKTAICAFFAAVICVFALGTSPDAISISVNPAVMYLEPDMIKLIEVDISPQNTNPKNIRYISGDNSIARAENSQIIGISPGYTEIYAEDIKSGVKSNIIKVTVLKSIASELSKTEEKKTEKNQIKEDNKSGTETAEDKPVQKDGVVYVGKSGTKYHRYNCGTLKSVKNEISVADAVAAGKTPCSRCKP